MLPGEAIRIRETLLAREGISPLLNLGSSTRHFREVAQPHVERELFGPLRAAGVAIVHGDLKAAVGVDHAGDILDPAVRRDLAARGFKCLLLSNLLEHVRDRAAVTAACEEIVGPGGLILATVPSSYPYHADPIDTLYRPAPAELAALFTGSRALIAEEVVGGTYRDELKGRGVRAPVELARTFLWALIALARPKSFAARAHRWFWYSRPHRVAVALVRVR